MAFLDFRREVPIPLNLDQRRFHRLPEAWAVALLALAARLPAADSSSRADYWWRSPPARPTLPPVRDAAWARGPIDAFILSRLEAKGLAPASPASKAELARRAWFDLTGLPPPPEEMETFLADDSRDAYEKLIDRLLDSPRYGERWGRHWLDLVRFAESNGYERDGAKPNAWRYRDYVIRSLNEDKPYDRFILEQLAGDELDEPTHDSLIATGFYRLGSWDDEPDDKETARYDELDDIIQTTTGAFLGLTVSCARCHDHKFDAIPQVDYYRLLAFFSGLKHADDIPLAPADEVERYRSAMAEADARVKGLEKEAAGLPEGAKERKAEIRSLVDQINKARPPLYTAAMGIREEGRDPPATRLLVRGNAREPGAEVRPGYPSLLTSMEPVVSAASRSGTSGRRRALAEWIASPSNPLTARVLVNRLWQFHFGRGIVRSPSDFGVTGDAPTHPDLLDWLAVELVAGGWRLKHLHRLIMTSSAYRMSSRGDVKAVATDPVNDLFSRFDLRRLDAEAIRDAVLSVSGRLNLEMGGPSVFPEIPREVLHGQSRPGDGWGRSDPSQASRRSVYVFVKRSLVLPVLEAFDFADTGQTCARRNTTTIAPQALTLLNGDFTTQAAGSFADRLCREAGTDPRRQVERAFRLALARPPDGGEVETALSLIERQRLLISRSAPAENRPGDEEAARRALSAFCLVLFNLNEFLYLD
jgi:hypothetical protein